MSINRIFTYRIFCNTENDWIYRNEDARTTVQPKCFNNPLHDVDANSLEVVYVREANATFSENLPVTKFGETRTTERTLVLELKSAYGKSNLRDTYIEEGTGTVTNNIGDSFFSVEVFGANDRSVLRSRERTRYKAGFEAEAGVAVLLNPLPLIGNQVGKFGLFDEDDGFYFKYTAGTLNVAVLRSGIETVIPNVDWNYDRLDGNGPSLHVFNFARSNIFEFIYTLQGAGSIGFFVNCVNSVTRIQSSFLVHTYISPFTTAVSQPNLPISVELDNQGTEGYRIVQVSGRQYSIVGRFDPIYRIVCDNAQAISVPSNTVFTPIFSIRRKIGYLGLPIRLDGFDIVSTVNIFVEVRLGGVLTGAVFGDLSDTNPEDTGVEYDKTATAITGGQPIYCQIVTGDNKSSTAATTRLTTNLSEDEILTVCARAVTSTGTVTAAVLRWQEEW